MIPRLYDSTETTFDFVGDPLVDCVSCLVTEIRNGQFTLEMEYPKDGIHAGDLQVDKIILAKPYDGAEEAEPFRIVDINATLEGTITVNAEHVSYQLNHIIIGRNANRTRYPLNFWNIENSFRITPDNPFSFYTDISDDGGTVYDYGCEVPTPFRNLLGGSEHSMIDNYRGEFQWNRWTVKFLASRGADNGVVIAYGKNITGLDYQLDMSSVYTGVVAYYNNGTDYVESAQQTISNGLSFNRINVVDATSEFESTPTVQQLNTWAANYLAANHIDPKMTLTVEFVPLWQSEEYKDLYELEHVSLCDTVKVIYTPLNIVVTAKVVETIYDVLNEKYASVVIGTPSASLDDTIAEIIKEVKI